MMRCNARPAALRSFNSPLQSSLTSTLLPFLYQTRTLHYGVTLVTRYRKTGGNRTLRPSLQAISQCGSRSYAARSIEHDPAPRPRTKGNVPSDKFRNPKAKPPRTDRSTTNIPFRGHELRSRKARPSRIDHTASIPFRDHEHRSHKAEPSSEDLADNIHFDKYEYQPQRAKPSPEDLANDMLFDKYEYESQGGNRLPVYIPRTLLPMTLRIISKRQHLPRRISPTMPFSKSMSCGLKDRSISRAITT